MRWRVLISLPIVFTVHPTGTKYKYNVALQRHYASEVHHMRTLPMMAQAALAALALGVLAACGGGDGTKSYTVGGTVSGLEGSGLELLMNDGDTLVVARNGSFAFAQPVSSGAHFAVTVRKQPVDPTETCVVSDGTGFVNRSDIRTISVRCTITAYDVGGTVTGLAGSGLILQAPDGSAVALDSDGAFTFPRPVESGAQYSTSVVGQPTNPYQTCVIANASGTVGNSPVTDIRVTCATNKYFVRGTVAGLTGSGLVLRINGGENLRIDSSGPFQFSMPLSSGSAYSVIVESPSSTRREVCGLRNAVGTIGGADATVRVSCTVSLGFLYAVSGVDGKIVTYGIDPATGALIRVWPSVSTGGVPAGMIATPDGRFVYVSNAGSGNISTFRVDSDHGALTATNAPVSSESSRTQWTNLAVAPSGTHLYANNAGSDRIVTFTIDPANGMLVAVGALVFSQRQYIRMSIAPDGRHLYTLTVSLPNNVPASLALYSLDGATGALTAGAVLTLTHEAEQFAIDPVGRFLYVLSNGNQDPIDPTVIVTPYRIDPITGQLSPSGTPTTVASNGGQLALEPTGKYAYLLDDNNFSPADDRVASLAVDQSTGTVTEIGSPVLNAGAVGTLVCDASGQYVFVANGGGGGFGPWNDVSSYAIGTAVPTLGELTFASFGAEFPADAWAIAAGQMVVIE